MSLQEENTDTLNAPNAWKTDVAPRKLYTCHKFDCNFETFEPRKKCPECGFPIYDRQTFKLLGVLLCVLGGILAVGGAGLIVLVSYGRVRDTGIAILAYGILGSVTVMGLVILAGGFKQASTSHKSSSFASVFLVLLIVTAVIIAILKLVVAMD